MSRASSIPFNFDMQMAVFEKAGAPKGKRRRLAGIASIDTKDRQKEILLQRGLDFNDFHAHGWFNDNHGKGIEKLVGYPDPDTPIKKYKTGDVLPNGSKAKANCTWVEGYLLDTSRADEIWEIGQALKGTGRSLGLSVEGVVQQRGGNDGKVVTKALVRNVAVTHAPVNTDCSLELVAKSLQVFDHAEKALWNGGVDNTVPVGPQKGATAGQVITRQSLEHDLTSTEICPVCGAKIRKSWAEDRLPNATPEQIDYFLSIARILKMRGKI